jgi:hypothetical protein
VARERGSAGVSRMSGTQADDLGRTRAGWIEMTVGSRVVPPAYPICGESAWAEDSPVVVFVDLIRLGRSVVVGFG